MIEGRPRGTVLSGKERARAPLAAHRRISAAIAVGSQICPTIIGTNSSGAAAHHSSMWKSL